MRPYAKFAPTFWTGPTGKRIKAAGRDAQVLACYLFTCPSSTMYGLYYLPFPTLCHEAGFTENEARATLLVLAELDFAIYDFEAELVWVVEAARYQVDDHLEPRDKRVKGCVAAIRAFGSHPFAKAFYDRYREPFSLPDIIFSKGLARPSRPPLEALRSQEKEQKQKQEKKQEQNCAPAGAAAADAGDPPPEKPWSQEACDDWARYLGKPPGDRIGAALKPLLGKHGWHTVQPVWRWACEKAAASDAPDRWTPQGFARSFDALLARFRREGEGAATLARAGPGPPSKQTLLQRQQEENEAFRRARGCG